MWSGAAAADVLTAPTTAVALADVPSAPLRRASLISPATWSAFAPITTCSEVAEGSHDPTRSERL